MKRPQQCLAVFTLAPTSIVLWPLVMRNSGSSETLQYPLGSYADLGSLRDVTIQKNTTQIAKKAGHILRRKRRLCIQFLSKKRQETTDINGFWSILGFLGVVLGVFLVDPLYKNTNSKLLLENLKMLSV